MCVRKLYGNVDEFFNLIQDQTKNILRNLDLAGFLLILNKSFSMSEVIPIDYSRNLFKIQDITSIKLLL